MLCLMHWDGGQDYSISSIRCISKGSAEHELTQTESIQNKDDQLKEQIKLYNQSYGRQNTNRPKQSPDMQQYP